ncbi:hypothetical protein KAFR_0L00520 [Kazachstania africana CBS 2517]|uniref:Increased recombination centers protein 22 n=1 Tax=Kazachstania africana (strain ATCC 22294 / BCRC 22015 / CBS 2517 / CECT 1963 / NBRC 1671 / NRRL Y-8276) TaxID=1071382 RepID=H2B209_KAZAF|nr:hypothetical protein KAFR_0L00520 [Kazachstania africana CBS 2517]CCF60659.1 hypothetical protein KAFR_0L00520 [Kazachstania africana CBS 2517]
MKLTTLLSLLSIPLAFAQEDVTQEDVAQEAPNRTIDLDIKYEILEKPDADLTNFVEFEDNDVFTLNYTLTNREQDHNISIHAVSGSILALPEGRIVANVSKGDFEPAIFAAVNSTVTFQQKVEFVLNEGNYYLFPVLHALRHNVTQNDTDVEIAEPITVGSTPLLFSIAAPPMSFFNLQFLSIPILMSVLLGGLTYFGTKSGSSSTKRSASSKKTGTPSSTQEWLPEQYKKDN